VLQQARARLRLSPLSPAKTYHSPGLQGNLAKHPSPFPTNVTSYVSMHKNLHSHQKSEGIPEVMNLMDAYELKKDDWDSLQKFGQFTQHPDRTAEIPTKVSH